MTSSLSEEQFRMGACAACARQKRLCKLEVAAIPAPACPSCPAWLAAGGSGWTQTMWEEHGLSWFAQVDGVFNVDVYLRKIFLVDQRLQAAEEAVAACSTEDEPVRGSLDRDAAERWLRRVRAWAANLKRDLLVDSVPAPGRSVRTLCRPVRFV